MKEEVFLQIKLTYEAEITNIAEYSNTKIKKVNLPILLIAVEAITQT
jgi:hypothetical protein